MPGSNPSKPRPQKPKVNQEEKKELETNEPNKKVSGE